MNTEKLSISLPIVLVDFVEEYQATHHCKTKSEVILLALKLLRQQQLESAYAEAAKEINNDFDHTSGDGLDDETW